MAINCTSSILLNLLKSASFECKCSQLKSWIPKKNNSRCCWLVACWGAYWHRAFWFSQKLQSERYTENPVENPWKSSQLHRTKLRLWSCTQFWKQQKCSIAGRLPYFFVIVFWSLTLTSHCPTPPNTCFRIASTERLWKRTQNTQSTKEIIRFHVPASPGCGQASFIMGGVMSSKLPPVGDKDLRRKHSRNTATNMAWYGLHWHQFFKPDGFSNYIES